MPATTLRLRPSAGAAAATNAGLEIHAEAGGYAARFDGRRYTSSHRDGGLIAAPNEDCWRELRRELWAD
jgi:fructose-1,6-bisphosphatase/inositol monophosphatase family enzyme